VIFLTRKHNVQTDLPESEIAFSSSTLSTSFVTIFFVTTAMGVFLGVKVAIERPPEGISIIALIGVVWLMSFMLLAIHKVSFDVDQRIRSLEQQLEKLSDKQ